MKSFITSGPGTKFTLFLPYIPLTDGLFLQRRRLASCVSFGALFFDHSENAMQSIVVPGPRVRKGTKWT